MDTQEKSEARDADFLGNSFSIMEDMRRKGKLCDVTLKAGQESFAAHRLILAAGIPYFSGMFGNGYTESTREEITLVDVDPTALELLIRFAYSGKLRITTHNVEAVLRTSSYLDCKRATELCFQLMLKQLNSENALHILARAEETYCMSAIDSIYHYIDENFGDVCKTEAFFSASFCTLKSLIERDSLFVMTEDVVLAAVMKWVKTNEADRGVYLVDLLHHVRLPLVSSECLANWLSPETRSVVACRGLLDADNSIPDVSPLCFERYFESKQHLKYGKMGSALYSVCGIGKGISLNYYDFMHEKWVNLCSLEEVFTFDYGTYTVCTEDKIIFIEAGFICIFCLKKLETMSTVSESRIPSNSAMVAHDRKVYVLGGAGIAADVVHSVCLEQGTCVQLGRLTIKRHRASAASLGDYIYLTGGCLYSVSGPDDGEYNSDDDDMISVGNAERYDPRTGQCTEVSPMIQARCDHACAALNGQIYVCAGYDDYKWGDVVETVERYDPLTDQWSVIDALKDVIRNRSLVSCSGKLYAAEVDLCNDTTCFQLEIYDPNENCWKYGQPIPSSDDSETALLVGTHTASRFTG